MFGIAAFAEAPFSSLSGIFNLNKLEGHDMVSADAVDTDSTGIVVNQEATCNINVNGGTYIFLAIA